MKIDDLCAIKVMDWKRISEPAAWLPRLGDDEYWEGQAGEGRKRIEHWNPSTSLDDALVCLERAVGVDKWNCGKWSNGDNKVKYYCEIHRSPAEGAYGETLALAMCRAALRAMGVPESEISLAMEE